MKLKMNQKQQCFFIKQLQIKPPKNHSETKHRHFFRQPAPPKMHKNHIFLFLYGVLSAILCYFPFQNEKESSKPHFG